MGDEKSLPTFMNDLRHGCTLNVKSTLRVENPRGEPGAFVGWEERPAFLSDLRAVLAALPHEERNELLVEFAPYSAIDRSVSAAESRAAQLQQERTSILRNADYLRDKNEQLERERDELHQKLSRVYTAGEGENAYQFGARMQRERDLDREEIRVLKVDLAEQQRISDQRLADMHDKYREKVRALEAVASKARVAAQDWRDSAMKANSAGRRETLKDCAADIENILRAAAPQPEKAEQCECGVLAVVQSDLICRRCKKPYPESALDDEPESALIIVAHAAHTAAKAVNGPARAAFEVFERELMEAIDDAG